MARSSKATSSNKQPAHLKGKGFDAHPEHINRKGRIMPKDMRQFNELLDEIFAEQVEDERGRKVEKLRVMLNRMMISKNAASQIHLLDRRFGKIKENEVIEHVGEVVFHVVYDDDKDNPRPSEAKKASRKTKTNS